MKGGKGQGIHVAEIEGMLIVHQRRIVVGHEIRPVFIRGGFTVDFITDGRVVRALSIYEIGSLIFAGSGFAGDNDGGKGSAVFFNLILGAGLVVGAVVIGKIRFLLPGAGQLADGADFACFRAVSEAGIEVVVLLVFQITAL